MNEQEKRPSIRKGKTRTLKRFCMRFVIKRLMEKKKIPTITQLSLDTNIPNSTLNEWTSGRFTQNPEYLDDLARFFGVSCEYLMFGEDVDRERLNEEIKKLESELQRKELENFELRSQLSLFEMVENG